MEEDKEKSYDSADHYGGLTAMSVNKVVFTVISVAIRCIVGLAIIFVMVQGGRKAYAFGRDIFLDEPLTTEENAREITVTIPEGATAREIGDILERKNLIRDSNVFYIQSLCVDEGKRLKGGRYDLNTAMSAEEMMQVIGAKDTEESEK